MKKAQSRLIRKKKRKEKSLFNLAQILKNYLNYLPTLVLGGLFAVGLYHLITTVPPNKIKHFIVPNSYLPFTCGIFISIWFVSSFILLNSRRGLLISLSLTWLVFLKLQQVIFSPQLILFSLLPFVFLETFLTLTSPSS